MLFPSIQWIQSIDVYETADNIYLIGSDSDHNFFRVMQIARAPSAYGSPDFFPDTDYSSCCTAIEDESLFDRLWRLNITIYPGTYDRSTINDVLRVIQAERQSHSSENMRSTSLRSQSSWFGGLFKKKIDRSIGLSATHVDLGALESHPSNSKAFDVCPNRNVDITLTPVMRCYGVVGVVRFLRGFYLILITKCQLVAVIGEHKIFKVEDTCTIYIPGSKLDSGSISPSLTQQLSAGKSRTSTTMKTSDDQLASQTGLAFLQQYKSSSNRTRISADELRYLKLFNTVDLNSNFYFSHTYDLSHSLQYNMKMHNAYDIPEKGKTWAFRQLPDDRFIWNWRLIPLGFRPDQCTDSSPGNADWFTLLYHGTVIQTAWSTCGMPVYLTLIGRRSRHYAGTRFLKRGANLAGDVANEVETEQIVHCASRAMLHNSNCSSYVQMRGSVPLFWSQEPSKVVVGRPPVELIRDDPYCEAMGHHFSNLLKRHGSPIVAFNLMKRREKRRFELPLSERYEKGLAYLSQFLPSRIERDLPSTDTPLAPNSSPPIIYVAFDISRVQKHRRLIVLDQLRPVVEACIKRTGIFIHSIDRHGKNRATRGIEPHQCGLIRMNCMDCLDRTNTAQFVIGRVALAYQLYNLGFLAEPVIEADSVVEKLLHNMYDEHGDTLALQYAGSQLVHNINTYKKNKKLSSQSRDFMQAISRYYSNKFSDWDKQCVINLFLRIYRPISWSGSLFQLICEEVYQHVNTHLHSAPSDSASVLNKLQGLNPLMARIAASSMGHLWDLTSDAHMHWLDAVTRQEAVRSHFTDWCSLELLKSLPRGLDWESKERCLKKALLPSGHPSVDWSRQLYELSSYECIKDKLTGHLRWSEMSTYPSFVEHPVQIVTRGSPEECTPTRRVTLAHGLLTPPTSLPRAKMKPVASVPNLPQEVEQAGYSHTISPSANVQVTPKKPVSSGSNHPENPDDSSSESDATDMANTFFHVYPPSLSHEFIGPNRRGSIPGASSSSIAQLHAHRVASDSTFSLARHVNQISSSSCKCFDPNPARLKPTDVSVYQSYLDSCQSIQSSNASRPSFQLTDPGEDARQTYRYLVGLANGGTFRLPQQSLDVYHTTYTAARKLRCLNS